MGKGSGSTRASRSNNPKGFSRGGGLEAEEKQIKASLTERRAGLIDSLKATKVKGKVGELVNSEIERAITRTDEALKQVESVNSINDLESTTSRNAREIGSIVYRLNDMANTHEANANDATGRAKRTYEQAAMALRQTAYEIRTQVDNNYGNQELVRLWDIFHSQNRWK